ncbi:hypothetical protein [Variovorax sp. J22R115]|uniref:hypothetical protein n=1 Tax=Variovorax sp. J22R115 TaxID=3053509 RepID=UPI0025786007|nr:hypothetical protein [Variovorax sp. J22R115]MDM0047836.1 hypothetical protein [Variovorax sp. J22R115]
MPIARRPPDIDPDIAPLPVVAPTEAENRAAGLEEEEASAAKASDEADPLGGPKPQRS